MRRAFNIFLLMSIYFNRSASVRLQAALVTSSVLSASKAEVPVLAFGSCCSWNEFLHSLLLTRHCTDSQSNSVREKYLFRGRVKKRAQRRSGDSGMGSSAGKNTSPCPGGEKGVPGSDSRWRPVSEDCLVMIWDTVRVFTSGDPPRNTGFSWP